MAKKIEWVKVSGRDIIEAIISSRAPHDGLIINNTTYVPAWVKEAQEMYASKEDGYAQMDLGEFLSKMTPEDED